MKPMKSVFIIWNSALEFGTEIQAALASSFEIEETKTINLGSFFSSFVRELYESESMEDWKINKKLDCMLQYDEKSIMYIIVSIKNLEKEYNSNKKKVVIKSLDNSKSSIRASYKDKMQVYTFDTILHSSDDEQEFSENIRLISKYEQLIKQSNQEKLSL